MCFLSSDLHNHRSRALVLTFGIDAQSIDIHGDTAVTVRERCRLGEKQNSSNWQMMSFGLIFHRNAERYSVLYRGSREDMAKWIGCLTQDQKVWGLIPTHCWSYFLPMLCLYIWTSHTFKFVLCMSYNTVIIHEILVYILLVSVLV